MLSSSHRNSGASRMRPYLTTSLSPDASSRSGSVRSVAMSTSTHLRHRSHIRLTFQGTYSPRIVPLHSASRLKRPMQYRRMVIIRVRQRHIASPYFPQ